MWLETDGHQSQSAKVTSHANVKIDHINKIQNYTQNIIIIMVIIVHGWKRTFINSAARMTTLVVPSPTDSS